MKSRIKTAILLTVLGSALAPTLVFGQTTYVWTNQTPGLLVSGDLIQATNWNPNGVPSSQTGPNGGGVCGDEMQFDGQTTGPLAVTQNGSGIQPGGGNYSYGLRLHLTSNQTSSVTIQSPVAVSGAMQVNYFLIEAGSGGLNLGDHSGNCLDILAGYLNGQIFGFTNNSSTASVINESVRWRLGGGGGHPFVFAGAGDWIINNHMRSANSSAILVQKFGPGTMTWTGTNNANSNYPDPIGTPITIGGGTMIWKTSDLVGGSAGNPDIVHNGTLFEYDAPVGSGLIAGNISGTGAFQMNAGTLTLSGANAYSGGTVISGGTLQVGAGGTSGSLGSGPVTNNAGLVFNRADTVTFTNAISGSGSVVKFGSGTLTLAGANTYSGSTTVSNGTLVVSAVGGDMNASGGTLVPVGVGSIGTLNVASNLTISTGTILVSLNKSLLPSNSIVSVAGAISNSGGTLKLLNFGPNLVAGDTFAIFSQPVGGNAMTIVSPGFTVNNNLAVDGAVTVTSVAAPGSGQITATLSGGQLNLWWPAAWTGLHLQSQTNSMMLGLSTNWITIPGTDAGNSYVAPVSNANGCVFYRLAP